MCSSQRCCVTAGWLKRGGQAYCGKALKGLRPRSGAKGLTARNRALPAYPFATPTRSRRPQPLAQTSARLARQRLEDLKITTIGAHPDCITALITHSAFEVRALATPAALRHFAHDVGLPTAFMLFDLRLADRLAKQPIQPV